MVYCCSVIRFDDDHGQDEQIHLDCFCVIASGIEVGSTSPTSGTKKLKHLLLIFLVLVVPLTVCMYRDEDELPTL